MCSPIKEQTDSAAAAAFAAGWFTSGDAILAPESIQYVRLLKIPKFT